MSKNQFELHPDRLSTTDARGKRLFLHPADVRGFFRRQRTRVHLVLMAIFLYLPWVKIQGRQALLFDIAQRKFEIFGLSLRAHNAPLLLFVFGAAAFGLFFVTTVFGRIWCGWACPQTVFIDTVFRRIERWVEGPALERRRLDQSPLTFEKLWKRTLKWILYLIPTLIITHSFLAYFVGTEKLQLMMQTSPFENWSVFLLMIFLSGLVLFDFAWFREQFCTIVCPYGRFQSVLMDKHSMVVAYDKTRGEPRATPQAKALSKMHNSTLGDCVNCYRCVQVCPTGIDIRRGLQMECIACTGCIDACDEVMTKIKKPKGLIRYQSKFFEPATKNKFSVRAFSYLSLCLLSMMALGFSVSTMKPVSVEIFRAKEEPYKTQTLDDGSVMVLNHFKVEVSNQSSVDYALTFKVINSAQNISEIQLITAHQPVVLPEGKVTQIDVFMRFPKSVLSDGQKAITLLVTEENQETNEVLQIEKEVILAGPLL